MPIKICQYNFSDNILVWFLGLIWHFMKSRNFVYISLAVDLAIAVFKFIAAYFTSSASMVSEGVHSIIDAISQVLLIFGIVASGKKPDADRPFGYGKELYFWSFIVSLIIFLLGGCISIYKGVQQFKAPPVDGNMAWNYGILLVAFLFACISMVSALKVFNKQRGDTPFWPAVSNSKDPSVFIVLLGDIGDVTGLIIAFLGVLMRQLSHNVIYDAIASTAIGCIMLIISMLLVRESKSLLMGETIGKKTLQKIVAIAESDEAIVSIKKYFSMYMGPEEAILQLNAVFKNQLTTPEITEAISRVIKKIQSEFPRVRQIFIEPVAR